MSELELASRELASSAYELPTWMQDVLQQVDELYPVRADVLPEELCSYLDLLLPLRNLLLSNFSSVGKIGQNEELRIIAAAELLGTQRSVSVFFENGSLEFSFPLSTDASVSVRMIFPKNGLPDLQFTKHLRPGEEFDTHQSTPVFTPDFWQKLREELEEVLVYKVEQEFDQENLPSDEWITKTLGLAASSKASSEQKRINRRTFLAFLGLGALSTGIAFGLGGLRKKQKHIVESPLVQEVSSPTEREPILASLIRTPRMHSYSFRHDDQQEKAAQGAIPANNFIQSVFSFLDKNWRDPRIVSVGRDSMHIITFNIAGAPVGTTSESNAVLPYFQIVLNFDTQKPNKSTLIIHGDNPRNQLLLTTSTSVPITDLVAFPGCTWGQLYRSFSTGSICNDRFDAERMWRERIKKFGRGA
ncbi:MAG: hypothetical protein COU68_04470 [Candidatus Pacebacteria bacterium CG10_big_fil_rev_8_21_14_0_10_45_6]|nr:MAG: hypothetical protein COU68_04470 [Candidatus Pacebacteria bacterium CG10_big_fil_rev_8_21_14_0_10_45_6]